MCCPCGTVFKKTDRNGPCVFVTSQGERVPQSMEIQHSQANINPFQTVEKPFFSFLMLTYETKVPFTVHMPYRSIMCYMGAYLGKGAYWQFLNKLDSRETSLLNAVNHLKIFLIEFEICLYEHLYFLYIRNTLFPIVAFISMLWQLKVNMFYPKNSFPKVQ